MMVFLTELAYMGIGLMIVAGIPTCIYLALRETIYRKHFMKAFGLKELPEHIKVRTTKPGQALGNQYYILMNPQPIPPDCTMYVNGWYVTSNFMNDMLELVETLKSTGVTFSKDSRNEVPDDTAVPKRAGVVEKPLKCLFVLMAILCGLGALGTFLAYVLLLIQGINTITVA